MRRSSSGITFRKTTAMCCSSLEEGSIHARHGFVSS